MLKFFVILVMGIMLAFFRSVNGNSCIVGGLLV